MKHSAVLLFCLIAALEVSQSVTQKYGSTCSSAQRCDSRSGTISCSAENECRCADPQTMIYDEVQDVCVSRLGTMCYTRSLKNRHLRNCVAGATCAPVASGSVFGICHGIETRQEVHEVEEQEEESNDDSLFEDSTDETETTTDDDEESSTADESTSPDGSDDGNTSTGSSDATTTTPGSGDATTTPPGSSDATTTSPDSDDATTTTPDSGDATNTTPGGGNPPEASTQGANSVSVTVTLLGIVSMILFVNKL